MSGWTSFLYFSAECYKNRYTDFCHFEHLRHKMWGFEFSFNPVVTFSRSQENVTALWSNFQSSYFFVFSSPGGFRKYKKVTALQTCLRAVNFLFRTFSGFPPGFQRKYLASFCAYGILTVQNTCSYLQWGAYPQQFTVCFCRCLKIRTKSSVKTTD